MVSFGTATFDGSDMKIYLNGLLLGTNEWTESVVYNGSCVFRIGTDYNLSSGRSWNGQIDEVRIWNVARTQAQIRDDMCQSIDNTHPQWANLVGYWNMNEGTGDTIHDITTNNNHGTRQ